MYFQWKTSSFTILCLYILNLLRIVSVDLRNLLSEMFFNVLTYFHWFFWINKVDCYAAFTWNNIRHSLTLECGLNYLKQRIETYRSVLCDQFDADMFRSLHLHVCLAAYQSWQQLSLVRCRCLVTKHSSLSKLSRAQRGIDPTQRFAVPR